MFALWEVQVIGADNTERETAKTQQNSYYFSRVPSLLCPNLWVLGKHIIGRYEGT